MLFFIVEIFLLMFLVYWVFFVSRYRKNLVNFIFILKNVMYFFFYLS